MSPPPILYTISTLPSSFRALSLPTLPSDPNARVSYKELAEAFVSGHTGSAGFSELALLLLSVATWIWIVRIVGIWNQALYAERVSHAVAHGWALPEAPLECHNAATWKIRGQGGKRESFLPAPLLTAFIRDYLLLIVPVIFTLTIGADHSGWIFVSQLMSVGFLLLAFRLRFGCSCLSLAIVGMSRSSSATQDRRAVEEEATVVHQLNSMPKSFITNYRTSIMIGTCVAILAVDFVIFPRRFCKTETFGVSMMDGGVGSFIISHALTSIHARTALMRGGNKTKDESAAFDASPLHRRLVHTLRSILPLLCLAFARLFTIRAVDYQVHVSEYGVHWNFFFTLAAVALASSALSRTLHATKSAVLGCILMIVYQSSLSYTSLTSYLLHAPRLSLLSANKEGIFSSIGYFSIYLISVRIGYECMKNEATAQAWGRKIRKMMFACLSLWCLTFITSSFVQPPSRRMVNASYSLWMLGLNLTLLISFILLDAIIILPPNISKHAKRKLMLDDSSSSSNGNGNASQTGNASVHEDDKEAKVKPYEQDVASLHPTSLIIRAINKNSLPFFMICNLLTGAVNLSIHTLFASNQTAIVTLLSYMFLSCLSIVWLDHRGLIIKI